MDPLHDNQERPVSSKTMVLVKVMLTMIGMMLMLMTIVVMMMQMKTNMK